jgi:hypothetical protein
VGQYASERPAQFGVARLAVGREFDLRQDATDLVAAHLTVGKHFAAGDFRGSENQDLARRRERPLASALANQFHHHQVLEGFVALILSNQTPSDIEADAVEGCSRFLAHGFGGDVGWILFEIQVDADCGTGR